MCQCVDVMWHVNVILEYIDHMLPPYILCSFTISLETCKEGYFVGFYYIYLLTTFLQSDHTTMSLRTNNCNVQIFINFFIRFFVIKLSFLLIMLCTKFT